MKETECKKIERAIDRLFFGLLFITLLSLKQTGNLEDISWLWVFAPIWIPAIASFLLEVASIIVCYWYRRHK